MSRGNATQVKSFAICIEKRQNYTWSDIHQSVSGKHFEISDSNSALKITGTLRREITKEENTVLLQDQHLRLVSGDQHKNADQVDIPDILINGDAANIDIDFSGQEVRIHSSLVGLPPVFYLDEPDRLIIVSDIHLLLKIPGCSLTFDKKSIQELCTIGYPINGKTLFRNVRMLPAAHLLSYTRKKQLVVSRYWSLPDIQQKVSWHEFLEQQKDAFLSAVGKIDASESFLSLTAGMDTRAILATLMAEGTSLPAYTMSGTNLSLDARTARKLCRSYGLEHNTVFLDSVFFNELPTFTTQACRLSGGLASLSQAHEVFFYNKVGNGYSSRLSGNLGNQVGRGGEAPIQVNGGDQRF